MSKAVSWAGRLTLDVEHVEAGGLGLEAGAAAHRAHLQ